MTMKPTPPPPDGPGDRPVSPGPPPEPRKDEIWLGTREAHGRHGRAMHITSESFVDELALALSEAVLDCHEDGRADLVRLQDYDGGDDLQTLRPGDLHKIIRDALSAKLLHAGGQPERPDSARKSEPFASFLNRAALRRREILQLLQEVLCAGDVSYALGASTEAGTWLNDCDVIDQDKLQTKIRTLLAEEQGENHESCESDE